MNTGIRADLLRRAASGERSNSQNDREDDVSSRLRVRHHFSPFTVLLIENEELLSYYTTPQANNQAENAGNAKEIIDRTSADFLPEACRDESS